MKPSQTFRSFRRWDEQWQKLGSAVSCTFTGLWWLPACPAWLLACPRCPRPRSNERSHTHTREMTVRSREVLVVGTQQCRNSAFRLWSVLLAGAQCPSWRNCPAAGTAIAPLSLQVPRPERYGSHLREQKPSFGNISIDVRTHLAGQQEPQSLRFARALRFACALRKPGCWVGPSSPWMSPRYHQKDVAGRTQIRGQADVKQRRRAGNVPVPRWPGLRVSAEPDVPSPRPDAEEWVARAGAAAVGRRSHGRLVLPQE